MTSNLSPVLVIMALFLAPAPAVADAADWLKRGQEILGSVGASQGSTESLTDAQLGSGLKEALRVGTERVVAQLGATDGFNADPVAHIPLPDSMKTVQSTLEKIGMSSMLDDLELRLNRAAETATPEAKQLFWDAIEEMTLEDARGLYTGGNRSATKYFQGKMSDPLRERMRPIVDASLAEAGAVQAFDQVMGSYQNIPFVPDVKADLTDHVLERGLDAIFKYVGKEEAGIRKDPAKRTTELLQQVFGG